MHKVFPGQAPTHAGEFAPLFLHRAGVSWAIVWLICDFDIFMNGVLCVKLIPRTFTYSVRPIFAATDKKAIVLMGETGLTSGKTKVLITPSEWDASTPTNSGYKWCYWCRDAWSPSELAVLRQKWLIHDLCIHMNGQQPFTSFRTGCKLGFRAIKEIRDYLYIYILTYYCHHWNLWFFHSTFISQSTFLSDRLHGKHS